MRTLTCTQGTDAWHAERVRRFTASEAPAMMGASKYQSRSDLLKQKHSGVVPEVGAHQQALFDRGHATEAAARTILEEDLGDLFPVTALHDEDDRLLASVDGITLDDSTLFEHKLWGDALATKVRAGELEPHYFWQLEHQLLVTGAERVVFVCSDGTRDHWAQMEYRPVPGRREQLLAGWAQFERDLSAYTPQAAAPVAVAAVMESLPAVSVRMEGALTVGSNLPEFGRALRAFVEKIPTNPSTDDDFATCEAACKSLKKAEEALEAAESSALASMASVEEMRRLVADFRTLARTTRLQREKLVEARKVEIRGEEVARGRAALAEFVAGLNATIGKPYMPAVNADFGTAIKGRKTVASLRDAIDTELARAKMAANDLCGTILVNMRQLREMAASHAFLFADTAHLVLKAPEDCKAVITSRIAEHKQAEEARLEKERERIRAEEAARADREAQERAAAERRQQEEAARATATALTPAPTAAPMPAPAAVANVVPMQRPTSAPVAPTAQPTLRLGQINERLAPISLTADGLAALGFPFSGTDKAAKLYFEHQFHGICAAIAQHAVAAANRLQAA